MPVTDVIEAGGILLRPSCDTLEGAVGALVASLVERGCLDQGLSDQAVAAVCGREQTASTAIVEIGVSMPHARLAGVGGVVGALAVSSSAVYYAMTGVPISIVALILSGPEHVSEHLNMLAGLSMLLQSPSVRRGLEEAADTATALAVLRAQGSVAS